MAMQSRILVVDDDELVRDLIVTALEAAGYETIAFADGKHVLEALPSVSFDLAIIDLVLPDIDGLELVRSIRRMPGVGVIVLSAQSHLADRIVGLEVGADDYVTKPFQSRELIARIHTVMRRIKKPLGQKPPGDAPAEHYEFEGWRLDSAAFTVQKPDGELLSLTTGEFKLLEFLVSHPNRFWGAQQLAELAVAGNTTASPATIMSRIKRLRSRLGEDARNPRFIATSRGGGYKFVARVVRMSSP
jgi:two-component system OmpR family response regulator